MSDLRRQFIENNREIFQNYLEKVSHKRRPVFGFGALTAIESIKEMLEGSDDFYLPLCLIHLF